MQIKDHFKIRKVKQFKKQVKDLGLPEALALRERRLDTLLWKSGLTESIEEARLCIRKGMVTVNNKNMLIRFSEKGDGGTKIFEPIRPGLLLELGDLATILSTAAAPSVTRESTQNAEDEDSENSEAKEEAEVEDETDEMAEDPDSEGGVDAGKKLVITPDRILQQVQVASEEKWEKKPQVPFHIDVHYGSLTLVLSGAPETRKIEYPFKML